MHEEGTPSTSRHADQCAKSITHLDEARSRQMTEWQQRMGTVVERDQFILENYTWSDLTVIVGDYGSEAGIKVFEIHRLQVAKLSSVLASMIYCDDNLFDEHTCIHLPDLTPEVFTSVIDYMYDIKPTLNSTEHAKALMEAAEKYKLPLYVIGDCEAVIEEEIMRYNDCMTGKAEKPKVKQRKICTDQVCPPWQMRMFSMYTRDKFILENDMWADCTFRVGEGAIFRAHRLVLAKTSPVFATMLYGHWATREEIQITDVTAEAFSYFLGYAYQGKLYVSMDKFMKFIWDFLYLAKKYLLPDRLLTQCRTWIFFNIYSDNFWEHFQRSKFLGENKLHTACEQILQQFTSFCLQLPAWLNVDVGTVKWLVRQENLECREFVLFQYCVSWAKAQLKSKGKRYTPENIVTCLKDILPHIRLKAMKPEEFKAGPEKINTLTKEELKEVKERINMIARNWKKSPSQRGTNFKKNIYYYGCCTEDLNYRNVKLKNNTYRAFVSSTNLFYSKKTARYNWITNVTIPSQKRPEKCKSNVYDEDVSIFAYDTNFGDLLGIARFTGQAKYNKHIQMQFPKPIHSHSKDVIMTFVPHKSGLYPYTELRKPVHKFIRVGSRFMPVYETEICSRFITSREVNDRRVMRNISRCGQCEQRLYVNYRPRHSISSSVETSSSQSSSDLEHAPILHSFDEWLDNAHRYFLSLQRLRSLSLSYESV